MAPPMKLGLWEMTLVDEDADAGDADAGADDEGAELRDGGVVE